MDQTVAIITPAWKAQATIVTTVQSALDQTHQAWELWLVADDGFDYEAFLAEAGISDPRIRFLSSGGSGRGASNARNVALEQITAPYAAILDADDRLKPQKLEKAVAALPAGETAEDYVVILPDWDGAFVAALGLEDVTRQLGVAVFAQDGSLLGLPQSGEIAPEVLRLLETRAA